MPVPLPEATIARRFVVLCPQATTNAKLCQGKKEKQASEVTMKQRSCPKNQGSQPVMQPLLICVNTHRSMEFLREIARRYS